MKKVVRLTESDLVRIVKKVISENKNTEIKIPAKFKHVRNEIGNTSTANEIRKMWNKYVLPDTMGDNLKLVSFENNKFENKRGTKIPINAVLDELNYALGGDDDEDED